MNNRYGNHQIDCFQTGVNTIKTITTVKSPRITGCAFPWFRLATILLSLVLLQSADEASGQINIYTLEVPGTAPWTDTGINITAGSQLAITASGIVGYGFESGQTTDANGGDISDVKFFADAVLPDAMGHSLIGKIGGTTEIGTGIPVPEGTPGNGPGFVGISYGEVISTSGELFLGFNDEAGTFYDNSGSFSVTITVIPVPEPSAAALLGLGGLVLWFRSNRRVRSVSNHT
jgi:hypothetical protein